MGMGILSINGHKIYQELWKCSEYSKKKNMSSWFELTLN